MAVRMTKMGVELVVAKETVAENHKLLAFLEENEDLGAGHYDELKEARIMFSAEKKVHEDAFEMPPFLVNLRVKTLPYWLALC